jgi:hypothetical protein
MSKQDVEQVHHDIRSVERRRGAGGGGDGGETLHLPSFGGAATEQQRPFIAAPSRMAVAAEERAHVGAAARDWGRAAVAGAAAGRVHSHTRTHGHEHTRTLARTLEGGEGLIEIPSADDIAGEIPSTSAPY